MSSGKAVLVHSSDDIWMKCYFPYNEVLLDGFKEIIPSFARKPVKNDKEFYWLVLEAYLDQVKFLLEDWFEVEEIRLAPKVTYPDDMSKVLAEEVQDLRNQRTSLQEELAQVHRNMAILRRENERLKAEATAQTFAYGQNQQQQYREVPRSAPAQLTSAQSIEFLFKSLPAKQYLALYKHLSLVLHPDAGGSNEMQKTLNSIWDKYKRI